MASVIFCCSQGEKWRCCCQASAIFQFPQSRYHHAQLPASAAREDDLKNLVKDKVDLEAALRLLSQFSLVKRLPVAGSISIHRLVQEVILHEFDEAELFARWETVAEFILVAFPDKVNEQTRDKCRKYQSQVIVPIVKSPLSKSLVLAHALGRVRRFLHKDGILLQAIDLFQKDRNIRVDASGEWHPSTLTTMNTWHRHTGIWDRTTWLWSWSWRC